MALVDFTFYSEALMRTVSAKAIIPFDGTSGMKPPYKTIYLLHGLTEDSAAWLVHTRIYDMAQAHGVAVVMPSGENMFYTDNQSTGYNFGKYIGIDLVEATRKLFSLSHEREDTYIAGLSMGGYGAVRNGLEYHEVFGAFGGFSPALITRWAAQEWFWKKRSPFHEWNAFGDPEKIEGSRHDPFHLVDAIAEHSPKRMPKIYLSCGTEDELIAPAREFRDYLKSKGFACAYYEGPGRHDWDFWNADIDRFFQWLNL